MYHQMHVFSSHHPSPKLPILCFPKVCVIFCLLFNLFSIKEEPQLSNQVNFVGVKIKCSFQASVHLQAWICEGIGKAVAGFKL